MKPSLPYLVGKYAILTLSTFLQSAIAVALLWALAIFIGWWEPWRQPITDYARHEYDSRTVLIAFVAICACMALMGLIHWRRERGKDAGETGSTNNP